MKAFLAFYVPSGSLPEALSGSLYNFGELESQRLKGRIVGAMEARPPWQREWPAIWKPPYGESCFLPLRRAPVQRTSYLFDLQFSLIRPYRRFLQRRRRSQAGSPYRVVRVR